jgi:hypothetical protein
VNRFLARLPTTVNPSVLRFLPSKTTALPHRLDEDDNDRDEDKSNEAENTSKAGGLSTWRGGPRSFGALQCTGRASEGSWGCGRHNFEAGTRLVLAGTIQFATAVQKAREELALDYPALHLPQSKPLSPGAPFPLVSRARPFHLSPNAALQLVVSCASSTCLLVAPAPPTCLPVRPSDLSPPPIFPAHGPLPQSL